VTEIFVALVDEAWDCWRPVAAEELGNGLYRLVGSVPASEKWEFQPGEIVRVKEHVFFGGEKGLVAVEARPA
jgi:hypothetical protein